jgi:spore coat protein U-like protein
MKRYLLPAIVVACVAIATLSLPAPTRAGSSTGTMNVTASVGKSCVFTSGNLPFGNYDPIVANSVTALKITDTTTALTISCAASTTATISLNNGLNNASCTGSQTCMSDGSGDYLNYAVYTNNTFATIWNATNTVSYTSTSPGVPALKVNAQIPAAQNVPANSYTDTITATANF